MIRLINVSDLSDYLRRLDAKIAHHATYAEPIVPYLLKALLLHADANSIRQIGGETNKGAIIIFTYHKRPFRLKGNPNTQQIVLFDSRRKEVIATFDMDDDIEQKFADTLKKSGRLIVRNPGPTAKAEWALPALHV
jgi:hypothetical protein